jgi:hypothetical protein
MYMYMYMYMYTYMYIYICICTLYIPTYKALKTFPVLMQLSELLAVTNEDVINQPKWYKEWPKKCTHTYLLSV